MVFGIVTSFGVEKRVQGFLEVDQYGTMLRFVVDGRVVESDDVTGEAKALGDRFKGAFVLSHSEKWEFTDRKVKSMNTNTIRGRAIRISFEENDTGINCVQITMLRKDPTNALAKEGTEEFVVVMNKAFEELSGAGTIVSK